MMEFTIKRQSRALKFGNETYRQNLRKLIEFKVRDNIVLYAQKSPQLCLWTGLDAGEN